MVVLEAGTSRNAENWQRIVGKIYDAALGPLGWGETLRAIAGSLDASGALFGFNDVRADRGANTLSVDLDVEVMGTYATHYHRLDLWAQAARDLHEEDSCFGRQLIPDQQILRRSEFYNGFLRPLGVIDVMACICSKEDGKLGFASFFRPEESGCYELDDQKWFATLTPHLTRATKIHQHMTEILSDGGAHEAVLERLAFGVVIIDEFARMRFANRAARGILDAADGIGVTHDRLGCAKPDDDGRLNMAIQQALSTNGRAGRGGSLPVSRASGTPAYQVLVAPYQDHHVFCDGDLFGVPQRGAVVFIRDPASAPVSVFSILQGLYGLTEAESGVAVALAQGRALDRIADERQVTRNTIRTQLARIFDKTGTSRQAEVVMLIQSALIMSGLEIGS